MTAALLQERLAIQEKRMGIRDVAHTRRFLQPSQALWTRFLFRKNSLFAANIIIDDILPSGLHEGRLISLFFAARCDQGRDFRTAPRVSDILWSLDVAANFPEAR